MTDGTTKPKCVETLREIEAYLDDELDVTVRMRVQEHLVDCPPCMDRAEFSRHLKVMISSKCSGEVVPPDLAAKIQALLSDEAPTA